MEGVQVQDTMMIFNKYYFYRKPNSSPSHRNRVRKIKAGSLDPTKNLGGDGSRTFSLGPHYSTRGWSHFQNSLVLEKSSCIEWVQVCSIHWYGFCLSNRVSVTCPFSKSSLLQEKHDFWIKHSSPSFLHITRVTRLLSVCSLAHQWRELQGNFLCDNTVLWWQSFLSLWFHICCS